MSVTKEFESWINSLPIQTLTNELKEEILAELNAENNTNTFEDWLINLPLQTLTDELREEILNNCD